MDISVISLIIASVSALATIITALHLKHCKSGCCESDCYRSNSTPQTPLLKNPIPLAVGGGDTGISKGACTFTSLPSVQKQISLSIDC